MYQFIDTWVVSSLTTMNKVVVHIHVFGDYICTHVSHVYYQRMELVGHRVPLVHAARFPKWLNQFIFLPAMIMNYLYPW